MIYIKINIIVKKTIGINLGITQPQIIDKGVNPKYVIQKWTIVIFVILQSVYSKIMLLVEKIIPISDQRITDAVVAFKLLENLFTNITGAG